MFNINFIDDLDNPVKHIERMMDSVVYITSRLETFYNTDQERQDIQRNIDYLKLMITKDFIVQNITESELSQVNSAIDNGEITLNIPHP